MESDLSKDPRTSNPKEENKWPGYPWKASE